MFITISTSWAPFAIASLVSKAFTSLVFASKGNTITLHTLILVFSNCDYHFIYVYINENYKFLITFILDNIFCKSYVYMRLYLFCKILLINILSIIC